MPLTAYTRLLDSLDSGETVPADLIAAIIDITADSRELALSSTATRRRWR